MPIDDGGVLNRIALFCAGTMLHVPGKSDIIGCLGV